MDTAQLIEALNARRAFLSLTQQQLADRIGKDVTVVSRQLNPTSPGMQLNTLIEYAKALGGEIQFITNETLATLNDENLMSVRFRMSELGNQNERLKERLDDKDEKIHHLENMYFGLQKQLSRLTDEYIDLVRKVAEKI